MENNIMTIKGVRGYIDENGIAMLSVSDVARELSFIKKNSKIQ